VTNFVVLGSQLHTGGNDALKAANSDQTAALKPATDMLSR